MKPSHIKTKLIYKLLLATVIMFGVSCTSKRVDRQQHAGPASEIFDDPKPQTQESVDERAMAEIDRDQVMDQAFDSSDKQSIYQQAVIPLSRIVLEPKLIEKQDNQTSSKLYSLIQDFHTSYLLWLEKGGSLDADPQRIGEQWLKVLLANCDYQFQHCANLRLFARDGQQVAKILSYFIRGEDVRLTSLVQGKPQLECLRDKMCRQSLERLFQYVSLSEEVKSSDKSIWSDYVVIKWGMLRALMTKEESGPHVREKMQRENLIFSIIKARTKISPNDRLYSAVLDRSETFLLTPGGESTIANGLLELAIPHYIYQCVNKTGKGSGTECVKQNALRPEFKRAVETVLMRKPQEQDNLLTDTQNLSEADRERFMARQTELFFQSGYLQIIQDIKAQKIQSRMAGIEILNNLHLQPSTAANEYLYLLQGVFLGEVSPEIAKLMWQSLFQNREQLRAATTQFLQMHLIRLVIKTNQYMNTVYSDRSGRRNSETMIQRAISLSEGINNLWQQFYLNVRKLEIFFTQNIGQDEVLDVVSSHLNKIKTTIKFTSIYPNMMMMIYYLHDVDWVIKLNHYWFGEFSIDASLLSERLFTGSLSPWLSFGLDKNETVPLDSTGVLYAFHYALAMETFSTFAKLPEVTVDNSSENKANPEEDAARQCQSTSVVDKPRPSNVDEVQFFELVMKKYFDEYVNKLTIARNSLLNITLDRENYRRATQLCNELLPTEEDRDSFTVSQAWLKQVGTFSKGFRNYNDQQSFVDLVDALFVAPPAAPARRMGALASFSAQQSNSVAAYLKDIRTELNNRLEYVKILISIMENHMLKEVRQIPAANKQARQAKVAETKEKIARIKTIISTVEDLRQQVYTYVYKMLNDSGRCLDVISSVNRQRTKIILELEKNYIEDVFAWAAILSTPELRSKTLQGVVDYYGAIAEGDWRKSAWASAIARISWGPFYKLHFNTSFLDAINAYQKLLINDPRIEDVNLEGHTKIDNDVYKGFDKISYNSTNQYWEYNYSKTDFMMRVLQRLQPQVSGRNNTLSFPSEIPGGLSPTTTYQLNNIFNANSSRVYITTPVRLNPLFTEEEYRQARDTFVGTHMKKLNEYQSWNTGLVNPVYVENRKVILKELFLIGPQTVYDYTCNKTVSSTSQANQDCLKLGVTQKDLEPFCRDKTLKVQVTAQNIYDDLVAGVRHIHHSDVDLSILSLLEINKGYYDPQALNNTYLNAGNISESIPFFQSLYEDYADEVKSDNGIAKNYFKEQSDFGAFLITPDEPVEHAIKCRYYTWVRKNYDNLDNLLSYIQSRQQADVLTTDEAQWNLSEQSNITPILRYGPKSTDVIYSFTRSGDKGYFEPSKLSNIQEELARFHRDTSGFYNPQDRRTTRPDGRQKTALELYKPTALECSQFYDIPEEEWVK